MKDSELVDLYKFYVDTSLRTTERRNSANTFFVTANTGLFSALGVAHAAGLKILNFGWMFFISSAGLALCYYWYRLIRSYKGLNEAKFTIIHRLECVMEYKLFTDEWVELGEGKDPKVYQPVTELEMKIPGVFSLLYIVMLGWSIFEQLHRLT